MNSQSFLLHSGEAVPFYKYTSVLEMKLLACTLMNVLRFHLILLYRSYITHLFIYVI